MKVLLIRPKPEKSTIGLQHVMICEPLELEYLVSNIPEELKGSVQAKIYDYILEKKPFLEVIENEKPNFVVFTGYITHVETIKKMAHSIKEIDSSILTGVGGVHAEVVGVDFQDDALDFIYEKNGVDGFNRTLKGIINKESIDSIKDEIKLLERKEFNFNLIHPDRSSVKEYRSKYYYMFHNPCALIKTSYGCPYNCSFCFCKEITKGKYFSRDMKDVVEEIQSIKEDEIYIVDDDFLFGREKLKEFISLLQEGNIKKNFLVYGRADFIAYNEDLIIEFKRVGLRAVIVGIESIRDKDLTDYNKKTDVEINEKCIKILKKHDIELYATLILPMDFSKSDFKRLTNWLRALDVTFVNLQPLTPLPGTDIFEDYEDKLLVGRDQYHLFDMAHVVLKPQLMSVREFYIQILKSYYRIIIRPKHILRLIKKYGVKENMKMLKGSQLVSYQYIMKIIRG